MSNVIKPLAPDSRWLAGLVNPSLIGAAPYKIDTPRVDIKLDQNESPWDLPRELKEKVVKRLMDQAWNRYPPAFADDLAAKVATYVGVSADSVLLGPGSNYLVSLALSVFSKGTKTGGKVVIARPSFPLYESHCQYEGIPYEIWNLNQDLEYDPALLPDLPKNSVVIFASPNNPVGNVLKKKTFEDLLKKHPDVLWLADEAYFEYAAEPYTELIGKYANLMLLRTFSKTMGAAGVRVGYLVAAPEYLALLKKQRLPFLLNHFALVCADVLLTDPGMQKHLAAIQSNAVSQRTIVATELTRLGAKAGFQVKPSEANFLLLRWPDSDQSLAAYRKLVEQGILVRNVASGPGLAGCLRVTLGDEAENAALLRAFTKV